MVAVEKSLLSLSETARVLNSTPDVIERTAEALRLVLPLRLGGKLFFDDGSIERIRAAMGHDAEQR